MEGYPTDYLVHNRPLVALYGLRKKELEIKHDTAITSYPELAAYSFKYSSDLPLINGDVADRLLAAFEDDDGVRGAGAGRQRHPGCHFESIGREYVLPARKAQVPEEQQLGISPDSPVEIPSTLHSPLSPLTPTSPTFPDGIMTPLWITKHQRLLPSVVLLFYVLVSDPNSASLRDNQIKSDINTVKKNFGTCSSRTRFIGVFITEGSLQRTQDIDERITLIRKSTGLESKGVYSLNCEASPDLVSSFVKSLLLTIQPHYLEYYREISKHLRRKRNRGSIPSPTIPPTMGTSRALPVQGWNARYEFKLAIMAEFRGEMDAAERSYEAAYEYILGQDIVEIISNWSPRWNETRLLADAIAVRIIRTLLLSGQPNSAVESWQNHRDRIRDLVDRKGRGSSSYGWQAWEARWAVIMAELIQGCGQADVEAVNLSKARDPNYWLGLATHHLRWRRDLAESIPEDDRNLSQTGNKMDSYDIYLCPKPHEEFPFDDARVINHTDLILEHLSSIANTFQLRGERHELERVQYEMAKEEVRRRNFAAALDLLRPLWQTMTWRAEQWYEIVQEVGWAMRDCAYQVGDIKGVVSADWELLHRVFDRKTGFSYDLHNSWSAEYQSQPKPIIVLRDDSIVSFLSTDFHFRRAETKAGEQISSQLIVVSSAHEGSSPVQLSRITCHLQGSIKIIRICQEHPSKPIRRVNEQSEGQEAVNFRKLVIQEQTGSVETSNSARRELLGTADLTMYPGQTSIFEFTTVFREVGDVRIASITLSIEEKAFEVEYVQSFSASSEVSPWWTKDCHRLPNNRVSRSQSRDLKVLPKPPKINIEFPDLTRKLFTDENASVAIDVTNGEEEVVDASIEVRVLGPPGDVTYLSWNDDGPWLDGKDRGASLHHTSTSEQYQLKRNIGQLAPSAVSSQSVAFVPKSPTTEMLLEVTVHYHLVSDMATPITKSSTKDLLVVDPWQINYDFSPRIHPAKWPSLFSTLDGFDERAESSGEDVIASGINQRWWLSVNISPIPSSIISIEKLSIDVVSTDGGVVSTVTDTQHHHLTDSHDVALTGQHTFDCGIEIAKLSLEDRRSATLDLALQVTWKRTGPQQISNVSSLRVPRLLIPCGEPRVLASASPSVIPQMIHLEYSIENPSFHFLTFSLAMDASEQFAFSGPKLRALQLVPLSRHIIHYNLLPLVRGTWIQPQLKILDRYFNKTLRISATEGMKMDKKGILIWVDTDS